MLNKKLTAFAHCVSYVSLSACVWVCLCCVLCKGTRTLVHANVWICAPVYLWLMVYACVFVCWLSFLLYACFCCCCCCCGLMHIVPLYILKLTVASDLFIHIHLFRCILHIKLRTQKSYHSDDSTAMFCKKKKRRPKRLILFFPLSSHLHYIVHERFVMKGKPSSNFLTKIFVSRASPAFSMNKCMHCIASGQFWVTTMSKYFLFQPI